MSSCGAVPIDVWTVDLRSVTSEDACAGIGRSENERASRLRAPELADRFRSAHFALRRLLGGYLACDPLEVVLTVDADGRPQVKGEPLSFNTSRSGDLAVIGISRESSVGIDIEALRPIPEAISMARRYFHPSEYEFLSSTSADQLDRRFLEMWTAKEAILKAIGAGLPGGLGVTTGIGRPGPHLSSVSWHGERQVVVTERMRAEHGYVGAVATPGGWPVPHYRRFDAEQAEVCSSVAELPGRREAV